MKVEFETVPNPEEFPNEFLTVLNSNFALIVAAFERCVFRDLDETMSAELEFISQTLRVMNGILQDGSPASQAITGTGALTSAAVPSVVSPAGGSGASPRGVHGSGALSTAPASAGGEGSSGGEEPEPGLAGEIIIVVGHLGGGAFRGYRNLNSAVAMGSKTSQDLVDDVNVTSVELFDEGGGLKTFTFSFKNATDPTAGAVFGTYDKFVLPGGTVINFPPTISNVDVPDGDDLYTNYNWPITYDFSGWTVGSTQIIKLYTPV